MGLLSARLLPRNMWDMFSILDRWNRRRQHRDAAKPGGTIPFGYTPRIDARTSPIRC